MKKLFLSLVGVLLLSSSVLNASYASNLEVYPVEEDNTRCQSYATIIGLMYESEGHNYWEGYFAAYGYCLEQQQ